jgi:hypothetical protein
LTAVCFSPLAISISSLVAAMLCCLLFAVSMPAILVCDVLRCRSSIYILWTALDTNTSVIQSALRIAFLFTVCF